MRRYFWVPAVASAVLSPTTMAMAQPLTFYSGNQLYTWCEAPDSDACRAYIVGVADAASWLRSSGICLPQGVTVGQVTDVVRKDLRDRPQGRHYAAVTMVLAAFREAWPCP